MSQVRIPAYKGFLIIMENEVLNKNMTFSNENYLKVLLKLSGREEVRSSDVAKIQGITKASVSSMMRRLSYEGYITKEN